MLGIVFPSDVADCKKWRHWVIRKIVQICLYQHNSLRQPQFRKSCLIKSELICSLC